MSYTVEPKICRCFFADGRRDEIACFELEYETSSPEDAEFFAVYRADEDGHPQWVADFGLKEDAERYVAQMGADKYDYRIEADGDWYVVYRSWGSGPTDRVAEFRKLADAEHWVLEKREDQRRG